MKDIYLLSHCLLNNCSKYKDFSKEEALEENNKRNELLALLIKKNIQIYQLPCPEFTLLGGQRPGFFHEDFNNEQFKNNAKSILVPVIKDLLEYKKYGEEFNISTFIGLDGSPSCGVNFTCSQVSQDNIIPIPGVFVSLLKECLLENDINISYLSLEDGILKVQ